MSFNSKLVSLITVSAGVLFSYSAQAESFKHETTRDGITLNIEQKYSEEGSPQPQISINGAKLREFEFKQLLTLVHSDDLENDGSTESISVVHHWDGGNECPGHLTVFSVSSSGFYKSASLGGCTETFDIKTISADGLNMIEIETFQDDAKTTKTGHWHYFDGNLVQK